MRKKIARLDRNETTSLIGLFGHCVLQLIDQQAIQKVIKAKRSPTQTLKSIGTSNTDVNTTFLSIFMASLLKGLTTNTYQHLIRVLEQF